MVFKKMILSRVLSNGMKMEIAVVRNEGVFQAALYINGRPIPGPAQPEPLVPPKGDITHWMGNHPSVGLSSEEAEKIIREVKVENSVLTHRIAKGINLDD